MGDPQKSAGMRVIRRYLSSMIVPYSSAMRTATRQIDPVLRDTQGLIDELKAKIPGLSDSLPARRNLWGEEIVITDALGPDWISPVKASKETGDEVAAEIVRNDIALGYPSRILHRGGAKLRMTNEEYSRLMQIGGQEILNADEEPLKEALAKIINSPEYEGLTDGPDGGKAMLIKRTISSFYGVARGRLLSENQTLAADMQDAILEQQERRGAQPQL